MGVFRETSIDFHGSQRHGRFQLRHEGAGLRLDARDLPIVAQLAFKGFVIDQLLAVVVVALPELDEEVSGLQIVLDGVHDGQLKIPAADGLRAALACRFDQHKLSPLGRHPAQIRVFTQAQHVQRHGVGTVVAQFGEGLHQPLHHQVLAAGLGRRDVDAVEQLRSHHLVRLQQERQVVAPGIGQVLFAFVQQLVHLGHQGRADGFDALGVGPIQLVGAQDVLELSDQHVGFVDALLLERQQFLPGIVLQVLHQADEQVGSVVQRLGVLRPDEDHRQRIALLWLEFGHLSGIERARQEPELLELGHGHVGPWKLLHQVLQTPDVLDVGPCFLVGGPLGLALEHLPG